MSIGVNKAWEKLKCLDPGDVCKKARVYYNKENEGYILRSFGMDFSIHPMKREIKNISHGGENLLKRQGYFFNLSTLCYLINAKDIPLSGRLVKPSDVKGGALFFRGSHILPLNDIAEKYGADKTGFVEKGKSLNGKTLNYGDASFELLPLPRVPVALILWLADEEFPARADILFDATCEQHIPLDIIWSIAMLSVLVML